MTLSTKISNMKKYFEVRSISITSFSPSQLQHGTHMYVFFLPSLFSMFCSGYQDEFMQRIAVFYSLPFGMPHNFLDQEAVNWDRLDDGTLGLFCCFLCVLSIRYFVLSH